MRAFQSSWNIRKFILSIFQSKVNFDKHNSIEEIISALIEFLKTARVLCLVCPARGFFLPTKKGEW